MVVVIVIVVAVVVVAAFAFVRSRRHRDGVDSFRRQIDALSTEARRPVIDQVQSAAERQSDPDDPDDEDGSRGA